MTTFVFANEKKWDKAYDALDACIHSFASYGYKAITAFDEKTADYIRAFCKEHRVAYTEE